jgi:hypothetical protein
MGVVYQVFDRETNALVALKTLRQDDPVALYQFKQEFRSLANINHRNLVTLHELVSANDQWFFTMELVDGVDFLQYVRKEKPMPIADTLALGAFDQPAPAAKPLRRPATPPVDLVPLRRCMMQLAEGVHVLHEAGKLHRDIKPSNVLVTPTGRLVVLDFGLVTEMDRPENESNNLVGTAAYMAPEQGVGKAVSPASDWYSVGVMLYEALTGNVPFEGPPLAVVMEKQQSIPESPRSLLPQLPEDLDRLCMALLSPEPENRPSGEDVLEFLGSPSSKRLRHLPGTFSRTDSFIGRQKQFEELERAFRDSREGEAVTMFIHGRAGMGKTALLERFLQKIGRDAVVLGGRCYERESVPYKALDDLMDSLAHYLARLSDDDPDCLASILPDDAQAIARLFPVLRRVEPITKSYRDTEAGDPHILRRRGTEALRTLIGRLTARRPVVMTIDNLQWGDRDSISVLTDVLRPPGAPAVLMVVSYRSEEATGSEAVRMFLRSIRTVGLSSRHIIVGRLSDDETRRLVLSRLGENSPEAEKYAEALVAEARGNPFFIDELVRYILVGAAPDDGNASISLEEAIFARIDQLAGYARRLLELVAIAGRPMEQSVIADAADLGVRYTAVIARLRAGCLIRTRGTADYDRVEIYHDRIRETLVAHLDADRVRSLHARLARALEASKSASPEALVFHFHGAGEDERAGDHASRAADKAAEALAFARAAELYQTAIEYLPSEAVRAKALRAKLGDALANAGHGARAAEEYLMAATSSGPTKELEFRRRAAEQLLRAGYVDKGLETLSNVLDMVGMRLADSPEGALASLLERRAQLRVRGLHFKERDASQVSAEELTCVDVCWSAAAGLSTIDAIHGADFQARHLLLALKAGEPYRVARALAMEAAYSATGGQSTVKYTQELIGIARELAARLHNPHAQALAVMAEATAEYHTGAYARARASLERCGILLREQCTGVVFELATVDRMLADVLYYLGEVAMLCEHVPQSLREAERRGDLCAATDMRTGLPNLLWLAMDDVERATHETELAMKRWSQKGFHIQHYHDALARVHIALYQGASASALATMRTLWRQVHESMLQRIKAVHFESVFLLGRVLTAHATETGDLSVLEEAEQCAETLSMESMLAAGAAAHAIRAAIAHARGQAHDRIALLQQASQAFSQARMQLFAVACHFARGHLLASEEGDLLAHAQQDWMLAQGIANPRRFASMLLGISVLESS